MFPNRKRTTPDDRRRIIDMYDHGYSWQEIADRVGFSRVTVSNILREAGIVTNRTTRTFYKKNGTQGKGQSK